MIDNLQALIMLSELGTMAKTATALHLTQSTISKRVQQLEIELGKELVEKQGRYVRFTPDGLRLVEKARPLLREFREVLYEEATSSDKKIVLAVGDSVLSSWGADALAEVRKLVPGIELVINSHRGRVALDRVSSGEYMIALVPGRGEHAPNLHAELICEEPMVIIPSGLKCFRYPKSGEIPVISSNLTEATWTAIGDRVRRYCRRTGVKIKVVNTIQTFSGAAKLAEAGFSHGFVPRGVADCFGYPSRRLVKLPGEGVTRPVSVIGRSTMIAKPIVQDFVAALRKYMKSHTNYRTS